MMAFVALAVIGFGLFWIHPALLLIPIALAAGIAVTIDSERQQTARAEAREMRARHKAWDERRIAQERSREARRVLLRIGLKGLPFWERRWIVQTAINKGHLDV